MRSLRARFVYMRKKNKNRIKEKEKIILGGSICKDDPFVTLCSFDYIFCSILDEISIRKLRSIHIFFLV